MAVKHCIRCGYKMWYDEVKKKWYCTNPKCVKYKEPPASVQTQMKQEAIDE